MRLWHKKLIRVLPKDQLVGQWRELCLISKLIKENGTPNHILVNKILDYPLDHLYTYAQMVHNEMERRDYKCCWNRFAECLQHVSDSSSQNTGEGYTPVSERKLFSTWHNDRYYKQCFYNLQEKFDCGGIPEDEWLAILKSRYE